MNSWMSLMFISCLGCFTHSINADGWDTWDSDRPSLSTLLEDLEYNGKEIGEDKSLVPREVEQQVLALRNVDQFCPNENQDVSIPRQFDAREKWKNCAKLIETVWDQGNCRSSSVVAAASMAADRLCIATNGAFSSPLSAQYLMACGSSCERNELISTPLEFLRETGIPTGGPTLSKNLSESGCVPFEVAPCDHTATLGKSLKPCNYTGNYVHFECPEECSNDAYSKPLEDDIHKMKCIYEIEEYEESQMKKDIFSNGPILAGFVLFEDFLKYQKGVYRHYGYGPYIRIQTVKLIGWGVEKKVPYWLGVNSFGEKWGMKGLFKFFRGRNHLFVETMVAAGSF